MAEEIAFGSGSDSFAARRGDVVTRRVKPETPAVQAYLRHLEAAGFDAAPRVLGVEDDREVLSFVEGTVEHPGPMRRETAVRVALALRELHSIPFELPAGMQWRKDYYAAKIGNPTVIGHGDATPWNVVVRPDDSVVLIDWDTAGPIDPLVDFAQAAWVCSNLYSEDITAAEGHAPLDERLGTLRAMVDAYGVTAQQREGFVLLMIEFAVHSIAADADEYDVRRDTTDPVAAWGMAWRARASSWMLHHRAELEGAIR